MRLRAGWRLTICVSGSFGVRPDAAKDTRAVTPKLSRRLADGSESNASNSDRPSDRLADGLPAARAAAGNDRCMGSRLALARLPFRARRKRHFDSIELSEIEGRRSPRSRKKIRVWAGTPHGCNSTFSRRSGQRDSRAPRGSGSVPRLPLSGSSRKERALSVRYVPQWFFAQGALFDSAAQETGISGWFDLFPATRLFTGYSFRYGDVVSYATPPRPISSRSRRSENRLMCSGWNEWLIDSMRERKASRPESIRA